MTQPDERTQETLIDAVAAEVESHLPAAQAARITGFVRHYYAGIAARDLAERSIENLYGAALAHYNLLQRRKPGETRLHIYNPQLEQNGWQSTHTIVEVVSDDVPFLVDSTQMAIARLGSTTHLIVHPVFSVTRDDAGQLVGIGPPGDDGAAAAKGVRREAVMRFEVDRHTERADLDALDSAIREVIAEVVQVVADWRPMRDRLAELTAALRAAPPPVDAEDIEESLAFLDWLAEDHFAFLGYQAYEVTEENGASVLRPVSGSGLGIRRERPGAAEPRGITLRDDRARDVALSQTLLVVNKTSRRSRIHRDAFMDYIGLKRFDAHGRVVGEDRFLGLYSAVAYYRSAMHIPLLRRKLATVLDRTGFPRDSHARRALRNLLENFPRDELFQISAEELQEIAVGILRLQERQRTRLFVRRDPFNRFFSCLIFVPRDRYNTEIRRAIIAELEDALGGENLDYSLQITGSPLARIHLLIGIDRDQQHEFDVEAIERRLAALTRDWRDELHDALLEQFGEERGTALYNRYGNAFRADYRERYPAEVACFDIAKAERLAAGAALAMTLHRPPELPVNQLRLKLFHPDQPSPLSDTLPMLENLGMRVLDENPSTLHPTGRAPVWIHDFSLEHRAGELELEQIVDNFQALFERVWGGDSDNDGFNRLVLSARLDWRGITVLRAYARYLRQVRATFSQDYMERALDANPAIARLLVELFAARFDPAQAGAGPGAAAAIAERIVEALDGVANLDEDRILRGYLHAIQATLRTNHYQHLPDGTPKPWLALKFDPARVPDMPAPKPMYEIFVHGTRVEGVHLRGGPVARGGLRWSDRREDFRTEVLGLVKAQMVKNAVIVPVGSKGGFVCKRLPEGGDREAVQAEVIACYRTFIYGLLDLTDNIVEGAVVPPTDVVRHDGDDPYLVVAADKGTATFSDIANAVAGDYGYWLGDAFASGGSAGYDHKKMGITARGAWESVKRSFRELGLDTQAEEFTVAGVGDMSGDVFGNGMLLSERIRLVAAFDHRHIFIDPDPDAATGYAERARLFALPRSSWDDYERALISTGGGIWPRSAKSIELAPEARAALGAEQGRFTPNELIRTILAAPVDLLWNGGIGTYVKAHDETHGDVGDHGNDAVRIDATRLRCRVIGEGGNLGLTQRARIEFARRGGKVNSDAIDNSAGVDCSDHEVNIKILLNAVVDAGDMTSKQRNRLLEQMTDEVAALVLRNNYLQTQALTISETQASGMIDVHGRVIRFLEKQAGLDRALEYLPDEEELAARRNAGLGLFRPEFAVLLAYMKIHLFQQLLASTLPDDPDSVAALIGYFPRPLREKYDDILAGHRLHREIIATQLANAVVNRGGLTFIYRLGDETGAGADELTRAWAVAGRIFRLTGAMQAIEALDNRVPATAQTEMILEVRKLGERATRWLLYHAARPLPIAATVERFAAGVEEIAAALPRLIPPAFKARIRQRVAQYRRAGVDNDLAQQVARLTALLPALDIVEVAERSDTGVITAAGVYFALIERLGLDWLWLQATALARDDHWQSLARAAMRDDLQVQEQLLTADLLRTERKGKPAARVEAWMAANAARLARFDQLVTELRNAGTPDFTMLSVVMRELRALTAARGSDG